MVLCNSIKVSVFLCIFVCLSIPLFVCLYFVSVSFSLCVLCANLLVFKKVCVCVREFSGMIV